MIFKIFFLLAASFQNRHVGQPFVERVGSPPPYSQTLNLIAQYEWNQNGGYCGEASFIAAGLYYGQYCSQYTARSLASPGIPQEDPDSQLLIGVNDESTAAQMRLSAEEWDSESETDTDQFLAWVKEQTLSGYPTIIGIYNNEYLLYGYQDLDAGDENYDHIVPVTGIGSNHPLSDFSYYPDDQIYFQDNGLWFGFKNPPYSFNYGFDEFQLNREEANDPDGPIYSLSDNATNYGIAITGVVDENGDTIPIRLETNPTYELPAIIESTSIQPPPSPLTLTVIVTIPDETLSYNLYQYNDFSLVPTSQFNSNASNAIQTWTIPAHSGPVYEIEVSILSNETAAFRAVSTTAP